VAIAEFHSLEQAQAWKNSTTRKNLLPERDKAEKLMRAYVVEAVADLALGKIASTKTRHWPASGKSCGIGSRGAAVLS
jgi:hypothetical protein